MGDAPLVGLLGMTFAFDFLTRPSDDVLFDVAFH